MEREIEAAATTNASIKTFSLPFLQQQLDDVDDVDDVDDDDSDDDDDVDDDDDNDDDNDDDDDVDQKTAAGFPSCSINE